MDILTEIYRIKQVMGLITEQAVKKIQGSFNSTTGDAAHNFNEFESKIDTALSDFYGRGINPKIQSIEVTISKINDNSFKTTYSADIGESNDGKAWMGFTSRGSYGATYVQRANGQIDGTNNEDGRTLDEKLKSIGAVDIEKIYTYHNPDVPVLQYFYQFTKEDKKPHPTNNQATIQSVRDTSQVVNSTTPQNAPNTNNTQVTTATSTPTATASTNIGTLVATTLEEGQPGDPYVYIKNEDGDFLTYKCGKTNERCPDLSTNLYSVPWINVSQKVRDGAGEKYVTAETAIKTSIYKEGSITPAEEETTPENDINLKIKKAFRNKYYKYLIDVIKSRLTEYKVTKKPCLNDNTDGCGKDYIFVLRKTTNSAKYYKINLDTVKKSFNGKEPEYILDALLNTAMTAFTNDTTSIDIEGKAYKIGGKKQNSIMELSKVFDADNSEPKHAKNTKVQDLIKGKDFYINEA